jgi:hypothetical protein
MNHNKIWEGVAKQHFPKFIVVGLSGQYCVVIKKIARIAKLNPVKLRPYWEQLYRF